MRLIVTSDKPLLLKNEHTIMKKENVSKLLFVLSISVFGTIGVFVKFIPLSSKEIALWRSITAAVLILCFLLIRKERIEFKRIKKELPLLALSGIAIGANWIFLFEAYNYTTVCAASLSNYFAPVIVMLTCPIFFKEKLSIKQIVCFAGALIGLFMIMGVQDLSEGSTHLFGIFLGLCAAALYAFAIIINKLIKNVDGIQRTFWQFTSAAVVLLPYVLCTTGFSFADMNTRGWICLVTVGVVHTGVNYCIYFTSLKEVPGQNVAVLSYIDPMLSVILSVVILNETMTVWQIMGAVLMLGSMILSEIAPKRSEDMSAGPAPSAQGYDHS